MNSIRIFILICLYFTRSSSECTEEIRGGWNFRDESCYYVVKLSPDQWKPYSKLRFNDYRRACEKLNATLPVIDSEKEHEFLRQRTKYGDGLFNAFDYYLGLKHLLVEDSKIGKHKFVWHWIDGKSASDHGYTPKGWHFDASYPCVTLGWTGWRNELCWQWDSRDLYAVCERPYDASCEENFEAKSC